jgi:hypothetical protein
MDKRFDDFTEAIIGRFEQVDRRFEQMDRHLDQIEGRFEKVGDQISAVNCQLNAQFRWIIGLMAPLYMALIALVVKIFLG